MTEQRMVGFFEAFKRLWTTWNANGRASRSELWFAFLSNAIFSWLVGFLVGFVVVALHGNVDIAGKVLQGVISLAVIVPGICLWVRRLHDIGKSGWMMLLGFIPLAGPIILLVFALMPSQPAANKYGPVPNMVNYGSGAPSSLPI